MYTSAIIPLGTYVVIYFRNILGKRQTLLFLSPKRAARKREGVTSWIRVCLTSTEHKWGVLAIHVINVFVLRGILFYPFSGYIFGGTQL